MQTILVVLHLFLAIGLIGLILIQHGKGADMGAAFGSGASGTEFGAKGSASFLTRMTAGLATLFFITSMVMAYFASQRDDGNLVLDGMEQPVIEAPAQPQTDLPPIPSTSDVPSAPAASDDAGAVPQAAIPEAAVTAPETETVPSAPVEAAPVEAPQSAPEQPAETKE